MSEIAAICSTCDEKLPPDGWHVLGGLMVCVKCYWNGGGPFINNEQGEELNTAGQTFAEFSRQMEAILCPTAAGKGYNTTGVDGRNELYEFVQSFAGDGHALGEIVYKAKRYAAKGDPTELIKIASWAFLVWRHRKQDEAKG